jgi:hypothetical protein
VWWVCWLLVPVCFGWCASWSGKGWLALEDKVDCAAAAEGEATVVTQFWCVLEAASAEVCNGCAVRFVCLCVCVRVRDS